MTHVDEHVQVRTPSGKADEEDLLKCDTCEQDMLSDHIQDCKGCGWEDAVCFLCEDDYPCKHCGVMTCAHCHWSCRHGDCYFCEAHEAEGLRFRYPMVPVPFMLRYTRFCHSCWEDTVSRFLAPPS